MNMTITESDKRLLSFLAAVLLLLLLVFLVLRPLADKNSDLKRQITAAKDQEVVMDLGAALAEDAGTVEEVYEPFLIMEGFIKRTPRGREATDLAYRHLGRTRFGFSSDAPGLFDEVGT